MSEDRGIVKCTLQREGITEGPTTECTEFLTTKEPVMTEEHVITERCEENNSLLPSKEPPSHEEPKSLTHLQEWRYPSYVSPLERRFPPMESPSPYMMRPSESKYADTFGRFSQDGIPSYGGRYSPGEGIPPYGRYRKRMMQWHKRPMKYKYHAPDGKRLSAGGIVLYEDSPLGKGMWLIEEEEMGTRVYTDFGGKYDHNDGDINATITREFREEVYNTVEIPYVCIKRIPENQRVYIDGYDRKPVYVCIFSHIDTFDIRFDHDMIAQEREKIIVANPNIPERWYKTLNIKFVLLTDVLNGSAQLSGRLHAILTSLCEKRSEYSVDIQSFFTDFDIRQRVLNFERNKISQTVNGT